MKPRILFLTAFVPNHAAAAEKNTIFLLSDLSQYFDIDLIYFKYDNQKPFMPEEPNIRTLKIYRNTTIGKIGNILTCPLLNPFFTVRFNRRILKEVDRYVRDKNYSAVIAEHSAMFIYAKRLKFEGPKVLFSHDIMVQRISRVSNRLMTNFCKYTERKCLNVPNSRIFTISPKDSKLLKDIYGYDSDYSLAYIDPQILDSRPSEIKEEYVFIGKWSRADNLDGVVWFFKNVVPHIDKYITIHLLGKNFPQSAITNHNPKVKVVFDGFVENPYPMIANCKAMLSPLFSGAGVKQKVLEALACGTPVIGTDIAFEGISDRYKDLMILVKEPKDYLNAINNCDVSIQKRNEIKDVFLRDYKSGTIPAYLKDILS